MIPVEGDTGTLGGDRCRNTRSSVAVIESGNDTFSHSVLEAVEFLNE